MGLVAPRHVQDLPGSGIGACVSPALANVLFIMEPPGKPLIVDNIYKKLCTRLFSILDYKHLNEMEGSEKIHLCILCQLLAHKRSYIYRMTQCTNEVGVLALPFSLPPPLTC